MKINKLLTLLLVTLCAFHLKAQVSGIVFRDYNGNGTKETAEPLVAGILVKAYDSSGAQCGTTQTTTSASAPNYSLTGCTGNIRVEFEIPAIASKLKPNSTYDFSGLKGSTYGTSVQFVSSSQSNVNFAINYPSDFNTGATNSKIYVPMMNNGDPLGGGTSAPIKWFNGYPYNHSGNDPLNTNPVTDSLDGSTIGSVWGVAFSKQAQKIFTSAFVKRHVGLGVLGSGGIYLLTPSAGTFSVNQFYDMDANSYRTRASNTAPAYGLGSSYSLNGTSSKATYLGAIDPVTGQPEGLGVIGDNATVRLLPANIGKTPSYDPAAFDQVGKIGIGDMDISENGNKLWFVNQFDNKLYSIDITTFNNTGTKPNATNKASSSFGSFKTN